MQCWNPEKTQSFIGGAWRNIYAMPRAVCNEFGAWDIAPVRDDALGGIFNPAFNAYVYDSDYCLRSSREYSGQCAPSNAAHKDVTCPTCHVALSVCATRMQPHARQQRCLLLPMARGSSEGPGSCRPRLAFNKVASTLSLAAICTAHGEVHARSIHGRALPCMLLELFAATPFSCSPVVYVRMCMQVP